MAHSTDSGARLTPRGYLASHPRFDPTGLTRLWLLGMPMGWLEAPTLRFLTRFDAAFRQLGDFGVQLLAETPDEAGAMLCRAALAMRENALVRGWRNERYTVFAPLPDGTPDLSQPLFALERAAFRRLGLVSRAVHINGYAPERTLWVGRRAADKSVDPGRLDNLAAGGLPHGESERDCVVRELWEEAGVPATLAMQATPRGSIRATRNEPDGTHDEILYCYDLALPDDFVPHNVDGEVAGFQRLDVSTVLARLPEFTWDAGTVTAQFLIDHDWA
ncbi:NUDIX hydrolase [Chitiniphilus shinanonensis]|uniref:NUDIX hydrolase n=1 Tax=Chitiniphilus shinanonensis TaxID=553088 RepID=UPI003031BBBB